MFLLVVFLNNSFVLRHVCSVLVDIQVKLEKREYGAKVRLCQEFNFKGETNYIDSLHAK